MFSLRLNRLFSSPTGNVLNVAVDHGLFGEPRFLGGIEDIMSAIRTLVDAQPDAIQLSPGQARRLGEFRNRRLPSLVLRTDIANVYGPEGSREFHSLMIQDPVGTAVRLDAACVVVNLFDVPGEDRLREQCIQNITRLRADASQHNMPLMIEPLVMKSIGSGEPYGVDGDVDRITALVRQATELGADIIKADPADDMSQYHRVIEAAAVPVLVRGGGRAPDLEVLERTSQAMHHGARGIVYGRNIIQHERPAHMTRALMAVVHDDASPEEAALHLDESQS